MKPMIFKVADIKEDVKVVLDQNNVSDQLLETNDIDTLTLEDIIESKIVEAVRIVHNAAPIYLLDCGHNFGDELYWHGDDLWGWIRLPDDFMRLIGFKMDEWERPVYEALTVDSPEYMFMSSRIKGVRGVSQKPVCALIIRPEGKVLEFYSCKSQDAKVSMGIYLPNPVIDDLGGIEICEKCYKSAIYMMASLVVQSLGDSAKGEIFSSLSTQTLV